MKRPLLIWFICAILFVLCYLAGCRTGGRTLSSGSAGTVIKGKTGEQINRESKQFKAQPVKSAPVKSAPIKPEIKAESVAPKPLPPPPIRHKPLKPIEATLEPIKPTLPPTSFISPKPPKLEEKVNVRPINQPPQNKEKKVENGNGGGIIEKEKIKKMNWSDLLIFYILAFVTVWVVCSLWGRQLSLLFKSWIDKLKNWWNDSGVAKKPAIKKSAKRTVRKVQKKKIANKGERKSNLAAKKARKKK